MYSHLHLRSSFNGYGAVPSLQFVSPGLKRLFMARMANALRAEKRVRAYLTKFPT